MRKIVDFYRAVQSSYLLYSSLFVCTPIDNPFRLLIVMNDIIILDNTSPASRNIALNAVA